MGYEVVHLPKERWKGRILPMRYTTEEYYDVEIEKRESGFGVEIRRESFANPVTHTPEEYDFPDRLYADYWEGACAWGVLKDGELMAAVETCPEEWSNRLRITEIWVDEAYQKQGLGHALMEVAKEQALLENRRAIILETQSCNVNAIGFYLHEGYTLIGFDSCCYGNRDLERKEVRLELGWFPGRKKKLLRQDVEIRQERPEDYQEVEQMVRRAFWNKYRKGCTEHYLVHRLREDGEYLPELSRIAVKDGEVIGAIFYSRAVVQDGAKRHEVLTFGPLGVSREWQGAGVGEMLLRETMKLSADAGFPGIIILGEPGYYPRMGFRTCDQFGITTKDGKNFDAFMGIELKPGAFKNIRGKFQEADLFDRLTPEEAEEYDRQFPPLTKQYFPRQW